MYYATSTFPNDWEKNIELYVFDTKRERDDFAARTSVYGCGCSVPVVRKAIPAKKALDYAQYDSYGDPYAYLNGGGVRNFHHQGRDREEQSEKQLALL